MSTAMESLRPAHRIDFKELCRLYETGALDSDARVELIDGVIIDMEPTGIDHNWAVDCLSEIFHISLAGKVTVRTQGALLVDKWNFLMPDIILLEAPKTRYRHRHPSAEDILLVVEVSDSSLRHDLKVKLPLYAAHGAKEAWILDALSVELHVQRASEGDEPAQIQTLALTRGTKLPLHALPALEVDLSSLLDL